MSDELKYLSCNWCARNASTTIRLKTGRLSGICLDHLKTIPTERINGDLFTKEVSHDVAR